MHRKKNILGRSLEYLIEFVSPQSQIRKRKIRQLKELYEIVGNNRLSVLSIFCSRICQRRLQEANENEVSSS